MHFHTTPLTDLLILTPLVHEDARGFLFESYNDAALTKILGRAVTFVQDNQSFSHQNVLRGLHYQIGQPQAKLVRVLSGRIFNVTVDLRRSSPSFGKWFGTELSAENRHQLFVPPGFAHGFLTLSATSEVLYKMSAPYQPEAQRTLRYDDPTLAIKWPLTASPLLSEKDQQGQDFTALELFA